MSEVFADLFWIVAELYNCWSIVDCCTLAQCSCSLNLRDFVMFYWLWFTYFCAFGTLVVGCIAFLYVLRLIYCTLLPFRRWRSFYPRKHTGASQLFHWHQCACEDKSFIICGDGSGSSQCSAQPCLKIGICGTSTCRGQCRDMFWNVSFGTDYVSVWRCDQISINHKCIIWFFGSFFEVIDSWLETCGIHWELAGIGHSCCFAELNLLGTLATWMVCYSYFEFFILLLLSTFGR